MDIDKIAPPESFNVLYILSDIIKMFAGPEMENRIRNSFINEYIYIA